MLTYTGKVLNYIVATPEQPDDADNPLRLAVGNEASDRDIREFSRRFGCNVRDSYGSTEGIIIIRRDPSMPAGSLGTANASVKVIDPETREECPPVEFGADGRPTNLEVAIGEIVETEPTSGFEGYYKNEEATQARFRDGWYWSGDLAYRDADGWLYFAGRSNEWLRVDGENFAAAPVEAIVARFPDVRSLAVYAVPDDPVGDRVMVAIELVTGARVRRRRVRPVPRRAARPRHQVAAGVRARHRRTAEAGQHEGRQDAPAPRGVDRGHRPLAAGEGRGRSGR